MSVCCCFTCSLKVDQTCLYWLSAFKITGQSEYLIFFLTIDWSAWRAQRACRHKCRCCSESQEVSTQHSFLSSFGVQWITPALLGIKSQLYFFLSTVQEQRPAVFQMQLAIYYCFRIMALSVSKQWHKIVNKN